MTRKQRRGVLIGGCLAVLGVAVGLVLFAMRDSIVFFYSPSEVPEMFVQLESAATWSCLALIGYCDVSECYCYGHRFEFHCTCCLVEKENRKIGSLKIVQMLQRVSKSAHHYGNIPIPERDATGIG